MARLIPYFLTFVITVALHGTLHAQDDLIFGNTATTSTHPTNKKKDKSQKPKKLSYWIKNSSKGLLIGNACMEEFTNQMGFIYLIQVKAQINYVGALGRWRHNAGLKYKLFFTKGPFWKFKLKKRRKQCKSLTRDMVG